MKLILTLAAFAALLTTGCAHRTPEEQIRIAKAKQEAKAERAYFNSLPWWRKEELRMEPSMKNRMAAHQAAQPPGSMSTLPTLPSPGNDSRTMLSTTPYSIFR